MTLNAPVLPGSIPGGHHPSFFTARWARPKSKGSWSAQMWLPGAWTCLPWTLHLGETELTDGSLDGWKPVFWMGFIASTGGWCLHGIIKHGGFLSSIYWAKHVWGFTLMVKSWKVHTHRRCFCWELCQRPSCWRGRRRHEPPKLGG